jgi:hypothetical protein
MHIFHDLSAYLDGYEFPAPEAEIFNVALRTGTYTFSNYREDWSCGFLSLPTILIRSCQTRYKP